MGQVIFYCRRLLPLPDLDSACLIQITKIHTRRQTHTHRHRHTYTHTHSHTYTHIKTARPLPSLCLSCFFFFFCLPSLPRVTLPVCLVCVCVSSVCVSLVCVCVWRVCVRISCVLMNLYRQPGLLFVNAVNWAKAKRFVLASPSSLLTPILTACRSWPSSHGTPTVYPYVSPIASFPHRRNTPDRRLQLVRAGSAWTFLVAIFFCWYPVGDNKHSTASCSTTPCGVLYEVWQAGMPSTTDLTILHTICQNSHKSCRYELVYLFDRLC